VDIAFSPVVEKKGGLCAVLQNGWREVALVGLASPDRCVFSYQEKPQADRVEWSKMVDFGRELKGVSFMDGATLLGRTTEGKLHGLLKVERTDG